MTITTAIATISGFSVSLQAQALQAATATATITGASDSRGMSICELVSDQLAMWGVMCRHVAPDFVIARAIADLNAALQLVWNNAEGRNYWSNETITITLLAAASSQDLANDIQNVVGPCRLEANRRPLVPLGTLGELETFEDMYLNGETTTEPLAYHIDRMNQVGSDPAKCVFHVVPAVTAETDFLLEVVKEAPRFSEDDLNDCPLLPIPHRYVETLLRPIAIYLGSTFIMFRKADMKASIDREYQQAMISLGLADPLPGDAGDNKNKREEKP